MEAINRFKKITAALALIAAFGIGQSYAQTAPKKMEKEAKKSEQKVKEVKTKATEAEMKTKAAPVKATEKKEAAVKEKSMQTKKMADAKVAAVETKDKEVKDKAVKKETAKAQKQVTAVKKDAVATSDKATSEKYNGHTVYLGTKGGKFYINGNGNITYISDKKYLAAEDELLEEKGHHLMSFFILKLTEADPINKFYPDKKHSNCRHHREYCY